MRHSLVPRCRPLSRSLLLGLVGAVSACATSVAPAAPTNHPAAAETTRAAEPAEARATPSAVTNHRAPSSHVQLKVAPHLNGPLPPALTTELALPSLPEATPPAPLAAKYIPTTLPLGIKPHNLTIEAFDTRTRGGEGRPVYVSAPGPLARVQISYVERRQHAGNRVYRSCGEEMFHQPFVSPMRWETLAVNAKGVVEYRIHDGWFESRSCKASLVRETVIQPQPLLGGLLYAFRTRCDDCPARETITVLAPSTLETQVAGVGGTATAAQGSFAIIELPVRRGGATSFAANLSPYALISWNSALATELPPTHARLGIEISQTVADPSPIAIAFARFEVL